MSFSAKEMIRTRKSVRTYDGHPLTSADRTALEEWLDTVSNPFGCAVTFKILDARTHGLTSPVIAGTDTYVAAKATRSDLFEVGYGYSFESFCLFALSRGLGTVMLGGTLKRSAFEQAMELAADEVMPVASPVGYPAPRRGVREKLMRKAIKADERVPFGQVFFGQTYGTALRPEDAGVFADALEMVRWAPSAVNKQPWRVVVCGNVAHFFEARTLKDGALWDVQMVDMGIALAHLDLTMREDGHLGHFDRADPGMTLPEGVRYVTSYTCDR